MERGLRSMKRELRSFGSITLVILLGAGAMPSMGQQKQNPDQDRVIIERKHLIEGEGHTLLTAPDHGTFERHVMFQEPAHQGDFVFLATEMSLGGKLVKGAPYSAQAVTESTQVLSDGNRIVNKSVASVYRDSEGRTRREQTIKAIGPIGSRWRPDANDFCQRSCRGHELLDRSQNTDRS